MNYQAIKEALRASFHRSAAGLVAQYKQQNANKMFESEELNEAPKNKMLPDHEGNFHVVTLYDGDHLRAGPVDDTDAHHEQHAMAAGAHDHDLMSVGAGSTQYTASFKSHDKAHAFIKLMNNQKGVAASWHPGHGLNESVMPVNHVHVSELKNWAEHKAGMGAHIPFLANVKRKMAAGKYDHSKAPKLWAHHVESLALSYEKEHGSKGVKIFSKADKSAVANHLADYHKKQIESGKA